MTQTYETGYNSILAKKVNPSDTTINVATAPTVTKGRMLMQVGTLKEWITYTGASGTTLTGVTRGLSQTGIPSTGGTGQTWIAGTSIRLVAMHDQLPDINEDTTYSGVDTYQKLVATTYIKNAVYANNAARDAAIPSPSNGMTVYNTAAGVDQDYVSGAWVDRVAGTVPNASETVAGKVEQATIAEQTAGTELGTTGAPLFINPKNTVTVSAGAGDVGKLPKLDSTGKIDSSMLTSIFASIELGETATAADPMMLFNNSGVKAYRYTGFYNNKLNNSGWTTSGTSGSTNLNTKVLRISATTFVEVYTSYNSSLDTIMAVIGTLTNGVVTYGTPVTVFIGGGSGVGMTGFSICDLGTNKFAVVANTSADTSIYIYACTVSGTTITVGAQNTAHNASGVDASIIEITKVDTDKFAVFTLSTPGQLTCCTVSGTTITVGATTNPSINLNSMAQVAANKFVGCNTTGDVRLYTVSGTTVTEGSNFAIGTSYTNVTTTNYSTSSSYVLYSGTNGGSTFAFILDCSGSTATKGTTVTVLTSSTNTDNDLSGLSDVVVVSGGNKYYYYEVSGTTLTAKNNYTLTDTVTGNKGMSRLSFKNNIAAQGSKTVNPGTWQVNNTRRQIYGILQASGTTAQSKNIAGTGTNSVVHTFSNPGTLQYISDLTGAISSSPVNGIVLGPAYSTSSVTVGINYAGL